jgi:hypothetical protein
LLFFRTATAKIDGHCARETWANEHLLWSGLRTGWQKQRLVFRSRSPLPHEILAF